MNYKLKNLKHIIKCMWMLAAILVLLLPPVLTKNFAYAAASPTPVAISVTYYDGVYTRGWNWRTGQTVTIGQVQLVEKTGNLTKDNIKETDWAKGITVSAARMQVPPNALNDGPYHIWRANYDFTAAANGKTYLYRVGSPLAWSSVAEQRIDDGRDGVYLIYNTDPHETLDDTAEISFQTHPKAQAMITTGDFCNHTPDGRDLQQWNNVLDRPKNTLMNMVMTPVTGNHDSYSGFFAAHFNINAPAGQFDSGLFYSYTIGNVHITVINCYDPTGLPVNNGGDATYLEGMTPESSQVAWLKSDLAAAAANPNIEWKIVAMHVDVVSPFNSNPQRDLLRNTLLPIFAEYEVDLVMQGHKHGFSRSNPLDWSNETGTIAVDPATYSTQDYNIFGESKTYKVEPGGTSYWLVNPAGRGIWGSGNSSTPSPDNDRPEFVRSYTGAIANETRAVDSYMFGTISIKGSTLLCESYAVNRTTGVKTLHDSFGIIRNSAQGPVLPPAITAQPEVIQVGGQSTSLSAKAQSIDGGDLSYQWYKNTVNSNVGGIPIAGAESANYNLDSHDASPFYYVVVTNSLSGKMATTSAVATVKTKVNPTALGGVISPVAGAVPNKAINDGLGYTATLTWQNNPSTFDYNTEYTATITLTAKPGYSFTGYNDSASVSSFTVNGIAPTFVANDGDQLTLSVKFAKTAEQSVTPPGNNSSCRSSIASASGILTALLLLGVAMYIKRKAYNKR